MVNAIIADDSKFMRKLIRKVLEKAGVTVIAEAENGQEAIDYIKSFKPDLVILDINMPVMDGLEVLKQISSFLKEKEPKIIVLTAVNQSWAINEAVNLGVIGFIPKPFKPNQLLKVVKNAFNI